MVNEPLLRGQAQAPIVNLKVYHYLEHLPSERLLLGVRLAALRVRRRRVQGSGFSLPSSWVIFQALPSCWAVM